LASWWLAVALLGCQPTDASAPSPAAPPVEAVAVPEAPQPLEAPVTVAAPEAAPKPFALHETIPNGVPLAGCVLACKHLLELSLKEFPVDVDPKLREEHRAKLSGECPAGCMKVATLASNDCVLRATAIADLEACQP